MFCESDRIRIQRCTTELPEKYVRLSAMIGERSRRHGPRVSGGGGHRALPLRLDVEALMSQIVDVMLSWEERVRTRARLVEADTQQFRARRPSRALASACRTVAAHVDVLLGLQPDGMMRAMDIAHYEYLPADALDIVHPVAGWISYVTELGGAEAGMEILNLHHRCLDKLGFTPRHHDLQTGCWNERCEERALRRWDGTAGLADEVVCQKCGEQYVGERLRLLMVEEQAASGYRAG